MTNPSESVPRQKVSPIVIATLMNIQNGTVDPSTLTDDQRAACVCHLTHEGTMTVYEMSLFMKVSDRTIIRDRKKIREGRELSALIIEEADIAMDVIDDMEIACAKLRKAGKWKDALEIKLKCIATLQDMGIIKRVAQEHNLKGRLDILAILNAELEIRERREESPEDGDENAGNHDSNGSNGNGHAGASPQGGTRLEPIP